MKYLVNLFCVMFFLCGVVEAGIKKSNVTVLYVGGTPDINTSTEKVDSATVAASVKQRIEPLIGGEGRRN